MEGIDVTMIIVYPIYLTLGGRGVRWRDPRNRLSVNIRYTNSDVIINTDCLNISHLNNPFVIENGPINGYFIDNGEMIRVTNLVGYDGSSILKRCPACGVVEQLEGFDYEGRDTGVRRDQSNCMVCRANY